ncbi:hypothetical protein DSUL_50232 [Desulfovibrionales bacterium]
MTIILSSCLKFLSKLFHNKKILWTVYKNIGPLYFWQKNQPGEKRKKDMARAR